MKAYHDRRIEDRHFAPGDWVLLFNSRLRWFPGKLKSKWTGPYMLERVLPYGAIELLGKDGKSFKVNGQRIKRYFGSTEEINTVEDWRLQAA